MTAWDNADYDREATALARAFWAGRDQNGAALSELATKTARDNGLNPDQIRRLCRNANTKAFEQKHAALKGEIDRTPNFELADAESVIANLHQVVASSYTKQAEAEYPDLPNEYAPKPQPESQQEKVAALSQEIDALLPPRRSPLVELRRAEKRASDLAIERHELNFAWDAALNAIATQASYQGWDHDDFEKNAVAKFGAEVLPELNAIRHRCRMSPLGAGAADSEISEKLASLQGLWAGVNTAATAKLEEAMRARTKFASVVQSQEEVQANIARLKKVVRHG